MSSSPEMTPMAKLAPMYTIDQILGHNTQSQSRHQIQDHKTSPNIKGKGFKIRIHDIITFSMIALMV